MSYVLPMTVEDIRKRLQKVDELVVHPAVALGNVINIAVGYPIENGSEIKFKAPVGCSEVTELNITYENESKETVSKRFAFSDANGNNVGQVDNLFAKNAIVKVILDGVTTDNGVAFVQNADTNAYLEGRLNTIASRVSSLQPHLTSTYDNETRNVALHSVWAAAPAIANASEISEQANKALLGDTW